MNPLLDRSRRKVDEAAFFLDRMRATNGRQLYEEFLRVHQLRLTKGLVEVLVTTGAELAEDLVR